MLQDLFSDINLQIDGLWKDENEIWYISRDENVLYRYIISEKMKICVGKVNNSESDKNIFFRVHPNCIGYKEKIICIPDKGKTFVFVDKNNYKFRYLNIEVEDGIRLDLGNYKILGNILWCVSHNTNRIIAVNLESERIVFDEKIFENEVVKGVSAYINENQIYIATQNLKTVCIFDIKRNRREYVDIDTGENGYSTIAACKDDIYLSGKKKTIYRYDIKKKEVEAIKLDELYFNVFDASGITIDVGNSPIFHYSYFVGGYLVLLPWFYFDTSANCIVVMNIKNKEISYFNIYNQVFEIDCRRNNQYLVRVNIDENQIGVFIDTLGLKCIDIDTNSIFEMKYNVDEIARANVYFDSLDIAHEKLGTNLPKYLSYILDR